MANEIKLKPLTRLEAKDLYRCMGYTYFRCNTYRGRIQVTLASSQDEVIDILINNYPIFTQNIRLTFTSYNFVKFLSKDLNIKNKKHIALIEDHFVKLQKPKNQEKEIENLSNPVKSNREYEPIVISKWLKTKNNKFQVKRAHCVFNKYIPYFSTSLDGYIVANSKVVGILEIKCFDKAEVNGN